MGRRKSDFNDAFVVWLNDRMEETSVSSATLAARAGISQSMLSMIRSRERRGTRDTVMKIAAALYEGDPSDEAAKNSLVAEALNIAYSIPRNPSSEGYHRALDLYARYKAAPPRERQVIEHLLGLNQNHEDVSKESVTEIAPKYRDLEQNHGTNETLSPADIKLTSTAEELLARLRLNPAFASLNEVELRSTARSWDYLIRAKLFAEK